jgi:S1-C subfamily serine protease
VLTKELGVEGVFLLKVEPVSAADAAGLRGTTIDRDGNIIADDVIIALDGQTVDSVATLLARLEDHQIGDRVTVRIWRAGRELVVDVFLKGSN